MTTLAAAWITRMAERVAAGSRALTALGESLQLALADAGIGGTTLSRITPIDSATLLQWKLGEASSPYANTGTAGVCNVTLISGSGSSQTGLFGPCAGIHIGSTILRTADTSLGETASSCTLSCWIFPFSLATPYAGIVMKAYRPAGSWNDPWHTIGMASDPASAGPGSWCGEITVGGVLTRVVQGDVNASSKLRVGCWQHVACTFDGTALSIYLNGALAATINVPTPGALDWGTHGPWHIGGSGAGTGESFDGLIEDVRFESVLRSPAYLAAQYRAGVSQWLL